MVSKCANPACSAPFRYLHEGKLFRIERSIQKNSDQEHDSIGKKQAAHVEFFWLCKDCSQTLTLIFEKNVGITTRPIRRAFRAIS